jgi:23S rRNA (cytidine1920-2'-O)/16S rRNA (cytidine1409-2'-O)-methyltransferase
VDSSDSEPRPPKKERLDKLLVDRGLCDTRSQAQGLILAGNVLVSDAVVDKPGSLCPVGAEIQLKAALRYVSRGGLKLEKGLETFGVDVNNRVCMDVGASTGGFTDCLLQHGAAYVYAVDVGYGQLDWKLRQDNRVTVFERTHILTLEANLEPVPTLAVVDVSFISLKKVLPKVASCLSLSEVNAPKQIIALVKPQFEYRDYCNPKGFQGIVTDSSDLRVILTSLTQDLLMLLTEWRLVDMTASPIHGAKGNREFLVCFEKSEPNSPGEGFSEDTLDQRIDDLIVKYL